MASPLRTADEVAAAFLAGFGPATCEAYARDLRVWGDFLDGLGVEVLAAHRVHVDAFVRHGEENGTAPATIARRLSALNGFYAYALDEGLIVRSPITRIRRPRLNDESPCLGVSRAGLRALLDNSQASGLRDHALTCLLALSGLRISETLAADVTDLAHDRGHRTLKLRRKGGKRQTVALAPRTAAALDTMLDGRIHGPAPDDAWTATQPSRLSDAWHTQRASCTRFRLTRCATGSSRQPSTRACRSETFRTPPDTPTHVHHVDMTEDATPSIEPRRTPWRAI
jgi:site-specific recombinase XerC